MANNAFQATAFQNNAFQIRSDTPTPTPSSGSTLYRTRPTPIKRRVKLKPTRKQLWGF